MRSVHVKWNELIRIFQEAIITFYWQNLPPGIMHYRYGKSLHPKETMNPVLIEFKEPSS